MNEESNATFSGGESYDGGYSAPEPAPEPSNTEPSPTTADGSPSTFAIRVDPRSGRRQIVSVGGEDNGVEQTQPVYPDMAQQEQISYGLNIPQNLQQQNVQQQPLPSYANAGEVIAAMNSGTLDESRIPVSMAFQYAQFKQNLAKQQAANQQIQMERQQPQQEQQLTPEMIQSRQEYFAKVDSLAKTNALKDIGLSEDELITAEYSDDPEIQQRAQMYETALAMHRNNILQAVQAERARQQTEELSQKAIISNINAKITQLSKTEPHFNAIMDNMKTYFKDKTIPFDDGVRYLLAMNAYN